MYARNFMFELLIYMFENYLSSKNYIDYNNVSMELEAAGFDNEDIEDAFDWFSQLKVMSDKTPLAKGTFNNENLSIFTEKEYKKILGYHQGTYTKDMTSDLKPEEITEALRKINVIENIITEYFKLLINDKKTAIFTTAYFANVYTTKKTLIPKNYINSTMLDDIYLEKLVNIDNYSNNILDSSKFKSILQKAAAKISTVFHFSKKLTEWTNTYTEPKKP